MSHYLGIRIPNDLYCELKKEALQKEISLSQTARNYLLNSRLNNTESNNKFPKENTTEDSTPYPEGSWIRSKPLQVETVLLLRHLCLRADSQILRKVDAELDDLLGKQRKKIYED